MRVLMTLDAVGGVFTYGVELIAALREQDVEVAVAVLGPAPSPAQRSQLQEAGAVSYHHVDLRLEWMENPWKHLQWAASWLLELARDEQPDVVHANSYFCGGLRWPAPVAVVAHSCVYSWWQAVHGHEPPAGWRRYYRTVRCGLSGADAVVAPSRAMLGALQQIYGAAAASGRVIHNGLRPPAVPPVEEREPFALAAGRGWDEAKNLAVLDAVAGRLAAPVLVAGEPPRDRELGPRAGGAHWLGRLEPAQLAELRRSAAVFVSPARYEPFGLAILEAAQDGCALVLSAIPSLHELWGDDAMYVPPDDPEAIATAIERLLADPAKAAALGARARRRAERYSAEAMAADYAALYQELARRPLRTKVAA